MPVHMPRLVRDEKTGIYFFGWFWRRKSCRASGSKLVTGSSKTSSSGSCASARAGRWPWLRSAADKSCRSGPATAAGSGPQASRSAAACRRCAHGVVAGAARWRALKRRLPSVGLAQAEQGFEQRGLARAATAQQPLAFQQRMRLGDRQGLHRQFSGQLAHRRQYTPRDPLPRRTHADAPARRAGGRGARRSQGGC